MNLLAELYSQSDLMLGFSASPEKKEFDLNEVSLVDENTEVMELKDNPYLLSSLAPRLWPFMRHIITSVRHSAIRTLVSLSLLVEFSLNPLVVSVFSLVFYSKEFFIFMFI